MSELFGIPVSPAQAQAISTGVHGYKYVRPPQSILETVFFDWFWDRWVLMYPMWLAPNVVTFIGAFCIVIASLLVFGCSPEFNSEAPGWAYTAAGVLLFLYSTFDGTDGKQARRTGGGSPLGHMVDHGIDAFVGVLLPMWSADAAGLGIHSPLLPILIGTVQFAFFTSNMVIYHTGRQLFFKVDVQEAEMAVCAAMLARGLCGEAIFQLQPLTLLLSSSMTSSLPQAVVHLTLGQLLIVTSILSAFQNSVQYVAFMIGAYIRPSSDKAPPKGQRTKAGLARHFALISAFVGFAIYNLYTCACQQQQATSETESKPSAAAACWPVLLMQLFAFASLVNSLLVLVVADLPFPPLHYSVMLVALRAFGLSSLGGWGLFSAAVLCYGLYATAIVQVICDELKISLVRIIKKKD